MILWFNSSTSTIYKFLKKELLRTKISQEAHSMKSKERSWALTKEYSILEVKKDHEGPKSQKEEKKKEIIIINKK